MRTSEGSESKDFVTGSRTDICWLLFNRQLNEDEVNSVNNSPWKWDVNSFEIVGFRQVAAWRPSRRGTRGVVSKLWRRVIARCGVWWTTGGWSDITPTTSTMNRRHFDDNIVSTSLSICMLTSSISPPDKTYDRVRLAPHAQPWRFRESRQEQSVTKFRSLSWRCLLEEDAILLGDPARDGNTTCSTKVVILGLRYSTSFDEVI